MCIALLSIFFLLTAVDVLFAQEEEPLRGTSPTFTVPLPACLDGLDNDNDRRIDYPEDPGCSDSRDNDETDPPPPVAPPQAPLPPVRSFVSEPPAPLPPLPPIANLISEIQETPAYQVLETQVFNNPVVERTNTTVAAPVIIAAAAANTASVAVSGGFSALTLLTYLQGFLTQPLFLFARRRRKSWGVVYSSLTKLPIDLALVRLFSASPQGEKDRLIQTRVTDTKGRYLLLVSPGTYRIEVRKPGYTFPSYFLQGKSRDLDFVDLYFGDPVKVTSKHIEISHPIPLDPIEKIQTLSEVQRCKRTRVLQKTVAYSGPFFSVISLLITPTLTTGILLALQLFLLGLFKRLAYERVAHSWATVKDALTNQPLPYAVARIFDSNFNKLLETQVTDSQGRYAFLVGRGSFYVTVDKPTYTPWRSEIIDLTIPGSSELVRQDVQLQSG